MDAYKVMQCVQLGAQIYVGPVLVSPREDFPEPKPGLELRRDRSCDGLRPYVGSRG